MKKLQILIATLLCLLILHGCNNKDDDQVPAPQENTTTEKSGTTSENKPVDNGTNTNKPDTNNQGIQNNNVTPSETTENNNAFNFRDFDLDVEYEKDQSFEVDFENDDRGLEAKIENELNNETVSGDEAYERLRPIFENFTFDQNTSEDDVISEVLNAFNLHTNYKKFDLEIDFIDGSKREYNR